LVMSALGWVIVAVVLIIIGTVALRRRGTVGAVVRREMGSLSAAV
jgi:hypothetical protein